MLETKTTTRIETKTRIYQLKRFVTNYIVNEMKNTVQCNEKVKELSFAMVSHLSLIQCKNQEMFTQFHSASYSHLHLPPSWFPLILSRLYHKDAGSASQTLRNVFSLYFIRTRQQKSLFANFLAKSGIS